MSQQQHESKNFDTADVRYRENREQKIAAKIAEFKDICERYGKTASDVRILKGEELANCQTELRCFLPPGKYRNGVGIVVAVQSIDFLPNRERVIDCVVSYIVEHTGRELKADIGSFVAAQGFLHVPDAASL